MIIEKLQILTISLIEPAQKAKWLKWWNSK